MSTGKPSLSKALKSKDRIKYWNIAPGDTVKVITGPYKGKVGVVEELLKDKNKLRVSGVNILKRCLPAFIARHLAMPSRNVQYAGPIHYSNVKLMGEIPSAADPTGPKRRVEISRVHRGKTFYNKDKKQLTWRRWIPGENVFLPWPRNDRSSAVGPQDMQETQVSLTTYIETLQKSPVPPSLRHELRNKYSKFKRHDHDAIAVSDIEGLEEDVELTDDASIAQTSATSATTPTTTTTTTTAEGARVADALKGLKPRTIEILAQTMSKKSVEI